MRLFVAIRPPDAVRLRLDAALTQLRGHGWPVRWVEAASLHLTLRFLGAVDPGMTAAIVAVLERTGAGHARFEVRLAGLGAFPSLRRPRVLWAGVQAPPALADLQAALENDLRGLGIPPDERPFHAHVTLGRVRAGALPVGALDAASGAFAHTDTFAVDAVELMRSHLGRGGARYETVARAPLADGHPAA